MIDETATLKKFGYTSSACAHTLETKIVVRCDGCDKSRVVSMRAHYRMKHDLCKKCAHARPHSNTTRRKISATIQGIPYDEWDEFATPTPYCEKFDESCRERNREKHGRLCFLCGKDEINNGRKLSVHHVDMNKDQGCDDHEWSLVPLCAACHGKAHNPVWQARIEYLLS